MVLSLSVPAMTFDSDCLSSSARSGKDASVVRMQIDRTATAHAK